MLLGGTHICKLCSYKTNLKANFQLHCKTDKHLARLSLYNHIREGGPANEWKLSMLTGTNPTQLRCQACDYNTNSLHKLQSHVHTQSHEVSVILFNHLCQAELNLPKEVTSLSYTCTLCKFSSRGKAALLSHARSLLHLRAEQLCEARRVEAGGEQPGIADIFVVTDCSQYSDTEQAESSETGEDCEELSVIIISDLLMAIWQDPTHKYPGLSSVQFTDHKTSSIHSIRHQTQLFSSNLDPSVPPLGTGKPKKWFLYILV